MLINSKEFNSIKIDNVDFDFSNFYFLHKSYLPSYTTPSHRFLAWFIGFTEADGSFIVNNRGDLCFVITQSTMDINVLYYIRDIIGFGKVTPQSLKTSRFVTQSKKELEILIGLFNGNIILPLRKTKLEFFIQSFNTWVTKGKIKLNKVQYIQNNTILPTLSNSWLSGFTDGEGCFACSILNKKGFTFNFSISQYGECNKVILDNICTLFRVGKVNKHYVGKDNYEYRVSGLNNCINVFNYYDKYYLLTKKSLSYILWKQIHKELLNKDHLDLKKRLILKEKIKFINDR